MAETTLEEGSVIGFKGGQAGVEQVAFGDDYHVKSIRDLITTENLSNQSFRSVSLDRTADFPRGGDTQPAHSDRVWQHEHRGVPAVKPDALVVDLLEFRPAADPFDRAEFQRRITRC